MKLEIATRYTLVNANDKSNQMITESYEKIIELPNGFFALIGNGFCKICNSYGESLHLINTRNTEKFIVYREPNFICLNINEKWWFMQKDGRLSVSQYDDVDCGLGNDELIGVRVGKKWGYADNSGILHVPAIYDYCHFFSHSSTLPLMVKVNGKFTFCSPTDTEADFILFDNALPFKFENNLNKYVAVVFNDGKQNLLLEDGSFVFDEFVDAFFIYEKRGIITTNGDRRNWYTLNGNKIIEDCLAIRPQKDMPFFIVKKETGYGITDENGFFLTNCIYDSKMLLTEKMFILQKDGEFVLFKRDIGEIFTPKTASNKDCSEREYLDYVLKALEYYLA